MNRQTGTIAPIWLYLAGAIALIAALAGLVTVWDGYTNGLDKKGYDRGVSETTADWQKRDNAQLQAALAAQSEAEARAAHAESEAAAAQSAASENYQRGVKDGKAKTDALVAAARAGDLRLRDPGNQAGSGAARGNQAGAAQTAAGTGGCYGAAGAKLSVEASEFLLGLAGEADDTARQLAACQVILVSDRRLCNGP